jgi:DNA-binding LytR/AlgR family response regulator
MKLKALIIEDEEPASERLKKLIQNADPEIEIADVIVSVKSAVEYLKKNDPPDLIFLDIQLADGSSFEIFNHARVTSPIIFTTAFDEFALNAFKQNSVDYLLKPIKAVELNSAIKKFEELYYRQDVTLPDYKKLLKFLPKEKPEYKKRLLIRYGDLLKTINIDDAAYFFSENKATYLYTKQNLSYVIDHTLDELEKTLDPKIFFRINRRFIISIHSIDKMIAVSKSRVKLTLKPPTTYDTIASTDRSSGFKKWLAGE